MDNRKRSPNLRRSEKSLLEKLIIKKVPGAGGGLAKVSQARRTSCAKGGI